MSLARYLSKLGALLNSSGQVPAAGLASGAAVSNIGTGGITATQLASASVTRAKMGYAGAVLQVKTATKTAKQMCTATANTMNEMDTNFRVTITPTSNTSKFLLFMHINGGSNTGCTRFRFDYSVNGGGSWGQCDPVGDTDGSRTRSHCSLNIHTDGNVMQSCSAEILFSPATTSDIIFRVVMGADQPNYMMWNGSLNNPNNFLGNTMVSTLRVMEIAQ